jgi:2-oxoglutarate dehydrogenase E2 component (dihydrolipoamide succinyltransferase)
MAAEIKVPQIGESITEVTIGGWLLKEGEAVEIDKPIAVLESDKATMELPAQSAGVLAKILKKTGETAKVGEVIATIETDGARPAKPASADALAAAAPRAETSKTGAPEPKPRPAPREIPPPVPPTPTQKRTQPSPPTDAAPAKTVQGQEEEVVPMTRLRRTIARRLVEAQQTAALLTTFNEVDVSAVMALRKQFGESFQQKHRVKLGFMSFFVKAVIDALKLVPQVNAEIRGDDIIYKNHFDIAVAIGGGQGLVVPVLRHAERLSFAEIEAAIGDFAARARENKLKPEELQGGTFTISNGGIYGSLLSTPIINPPQSGILGMHAIQDRPVAREGQVVIRPMMYLALTYDHRLVDGKEAVTFLKRVKDVIEEPARMLIES